MSTVYSLYCPYHLYSTAQIHAHVCIRGSVDQASPAPAPLSIFPIVPPRPHPHCQLPSVDSLIYKSLLYTACLPYPTRRLLPISIIFITFNQQAPSLSNLTLRHVIIVITSFSFITGSPFEFQAFHKGGCTVKYSVLVYRTKYPYHASTCTALVSSPDASFSDARYSKLTQY